MQWLKRLQAYKRSDTLVSGMADCGSRVIFPKTSEQSDTIIEVTSGEYALVKVCYFLHWPRFYRFLFGKTLHIVLEPIKTEKRILSTFIQACLLEILR